MAIHFLISEELVLGPLETSRVVKKSWNLGPGLKPYQRKNLQQLVVESSCRSTICKIIAFFCQESTFQQIQVCSELSFFCKIYRRNKKWNQDIRTEKKDRDYTTTLTRYRVRIILGMIGYHRVFDMAPTNTVSSQQNQRLPFISCQITYGRSDNERTCSHKKIRLT